MENYIKKFVFDSKNKYGIEHKVVTDDEKEYGIEHKVVTGSEKFFDPDTKNRQPIKR